MVLIIGPVTQIAWILNTYMSLTLFTAGLDLITDQLGGWAGVLEHDQNVSAQGFMVGHCRQC